MSAFSFASPSVDPAPRGGIGRAWTFAFGCAAAGCTALALFAMAASPSGPLMTLAWKHAAQSQAELAFDSRLPSANMHILKGVSGEAVASRSVTDGDLAAATPAELLAGQQLSPVAWDRLSAGDCISLTIASGQKLSFRIIGAHRGEPARKPAETGRLDLAVTACAPGGESIVKAVIEAKTDGKESAIQRNL
jgi:hypothetical protein